MCVSVHARVHVVFGLGVFVGGRGAVNNGTGFPGGSVVRNLPPDAGGAGELVRSPGWENPSK